MERRASRLFGTKRAKQSDCDNNNNEVGVSNKNQQAAGPNAPTADEPSPRKHPEISKQLKKMSNEELTRLLAVEDDSVLDCIIGRVPKIRKLEDERDSLKEQVVNLAYCNQAREPEFVRDRLKLRELARDVGQLARHFSGKHLEPMVNKLRSAERELARLARSHEEQSEVVAQRFLEGDIAPAACDAAAATAVAAAGAADTAEREGWHGCGDAENRVHVFPSDYIEIRKGAIRKRTLADRLSKELGLLSGLGNRGPGTPTAAARQPSPVCRNPKAY